MRSPLVRIPAALAAAGMRLRPEEPADDPFLIELYGTTRVRELEQVPHWSDEQKLAFVRMQFDAQRLHYQTVLKDVSFDVIERGGVPIGRLYMQELETALHIVDIVFVPEQRGQGMGAVLLQELADSAAEAGKVLSIFVEFYNPARRLYERLGFVAVREEQGIYIEMELPLPADRAKVS